MMDSGRLGRQQRNPAGITEAPCVVHLGGLRDAILHSAGANSDHGVRRTNADKRRAVMLLLKDPEWSQWSDREIARRCAVATDTVSRYRKELGASVEIGQIDQPRTVSRGGKVFTMDTGRIGRKAEAEPGPPEDPAAPVPAPTGDAGNVVVLGSRLAIIPSPGAVERGRIGP
jgi:hypothetical protein